MNNKINLLSGAAISVYCLVCGVLYTAGFWSFFKINALQFIDLNDIIKSVAVPIGTAVIIYAVNVILNSYYIPDKETTDNYLKEGGVLKVWIYFIRTIIFFSCVGFIVAIFLNIFYFEPQYKILGYAMTLASASFFFIFFKTDFLSEFGKLRPMLITLICFMPIVSLNGGLHDGERILKGNDTYIVTTDSGCIGAHSDEKYRYISTLSDKVFAMSLKDGSVCVFKYNYIKLTKEKESQNSNEK